jgi:hypothetical protein
MQERKTLQLVRVDAITAASATKKEYLKEFHGYSDEALAEREDEAGFIIYENNGVGDTVCLWRSEEQFVQSAFPIGNVIGRMTFTAMSLSIIRDFHNQELERIQKKNEEGANDEATLKEANALLQESVLTDILIQKLTERKEIIDEVYRNTSAPNNEQEEKPEEDKPAEQ